MNLTINGKSYSLDDKYSETPLLWVLRDQYHLTGTKYGCGIGVCGSCIVLIDGQPKRSCLVAASHANNAQITTIEGISSDSSKHPVQIAWEKLQVPQCGYCQSGQILAAISYLNKDPDITDKGINDALSGVLCRCGTYPRVKEAIKYASNLLKK
ncbi:MAG: (2Fe-2S)-binding protein [Candidatus Thiodiazotropha weberae]|nr:(2Fe-2S)-binding protein [Candidatus Thiodiazotropha lotti]MCG8012615.1 (2Fe-2S)-binding protein [Candidatus Thiodiazotropha lotti]MCW4212086.1 (2Fe-2S)-binding protein [Candidatus Thiodiazotropha lotti]MCW4215884.1 (2Fe-2S)-binding protein [Candidatus Thiodiazotropha lotti]